MNRDNAAREMFLIAHEALAHYDVGNARPEFIGHGTSIVQFRIETQGGARRFLLRLHRPTAAGEAGLRRRRAHIESELNWLSDLDAAPEIGVAVQRPLRNRFGDFVTELSTLHGTFHASVLCWVDAIQPDPDEYTAEQASTLGAALATVHAHAAGWKLPGTFVRPRYDSERVLLTIDALAPLVRDGDISADVFSDLESLGERIAGEIAKLEDSGEPWHLVHGNIIPENVGFVGGRVHLRNFRSSGFGHPGQDVGRALQWLPQPLHPHLLAAYRASQHCDAEVGVLECLLTASLIDALPGEGVIDGPAVGKRVEALMANEARRYLNGERLITV